MKFESNGVIIEFENNKVITEYEIYSYLQRIHTSIYGKDFDDFNEGSLGKSIEKYDKYICKEIPLFKLNFNNFDIDSSKLFQYTDLKTVIPPILLDRKLNVIDGNHRCKAAEWNFETSESANEKEPIMLCFLPYSYRGKILKEWK